VTIRGIWRLRRLARDFTNVFIPRALILLYHRVTELPSDPQLLCVSRQHFSEHLEILRKHCRPTRLQELTKSLQDGNLLRRSIVVTFDDGYADSLLNAKPLLERYEIPSTVFVISGSVGQEREFWWDELDRLFLHTGRLPDRLRIVIDGHIHEWHLGAPSDNSQESTPQHSTWNVERKWDPAPRHRVYRALCDLLRPLPDRDQRAILETLGAWAGTERVCRPTHRPLRPQEVFQLAADGLVEVGAHTLTHPILSRLPEAMQRNEIERSKKQLEEVVGQPVASFAYPYGTRSDYTAQTVVAVRASGFNRACSNFPGTVRRGGDPWQLPRFLVRDWDGDEFAQRLEQWLAEDP
jgi:peptidoglycan/xylan/chitin deacetylase (PgdA/CDA1 family)